MPYEILEDEAPAPAGGGYEVLDDAPADTTPGTLEGIANSIRRGNLAGQRAIETVTLPAPGGPSIRQERRAFVGAMEDPAYLPNLMGAGDDPAKLQRIESLYGPKGRLDRARTPIEAARTAGAQNIADLTTEMAALPKSAAMQAWDKADNSNWWQVFARDPVEITANIFAESLPQASGAMVAGMAGGMAGGPVGAAAGAGTGSFAVEASNALLEAAAKQGVDLSDADQVRAFFADEAKVKAARQFAAARGFPIAMFDALTAGVAGKFLKPALGGGVAKVAGATALEGATQMAGGAAGEATAQLASGQDLSLKDIAAEAIGELATTPGEVVSNLREEIGARGGKGFEVLPERTAKVSDNPKVAAIEAAVNAAPPADTSADALAELQAAMRGNQGKPSRITEPPKPGVTRVESEPVVVRQTVEVPAELTEDQRAAIEQVKRQDAEVAKFVENPDKNYEGMSRLELELLDGMGDARATAALRAMNRRRAEKATVKESLQVQPEPALDTESPTGLQPAAVVPESTPSAPAETITGPSAREDEREGSAMPAEAGEDALGAPIPAPPALTSPEAPKKSRPQHSIGERPWDILDEIEAEVGGKIDPKLIRAANPNWKPVGAARKLFRKGGRGADVVLNAITYGGPKLGLQQDTGMQEFGDALNHAATARQGWKGQARQERTLLNEQAREAQTRRQFEDKVLEGERPKSARQGVQQVDIDGLVEGDTFKVQDHRFVVEALEFDPENDGRVSSVTLKDGPKFGTQTVEGREVIHIDEGTMRRNRKAREQASKAADFVPEVARETQQTPPAAPAPEAGALPAAPEQAVAPGRPGRETGPAPETEAAKGAGELPQQTDRVGETDPKPAAKSRQQRDFETKNPGALNNAKALGDREFEVVARAVGQGKRRFQVVGKQSGHGYFESPSREQAEMRLGQMREATKVSDPIESALDKAIEATDFKPGQVNEGVTGAPVWLTRAAANGALRILRAAYRAGKSIAQAVSEAVEFLRNQNLEGFNEAEARAWVENETAAEKAPGARERANAIGEEIAAHEARGETVPDELLERYKTAVDELGEEIRSGREKAGAVGNAGSAVDANLKPANRRDAEAQSDEDSSASRRLVGKSFQGGERLPSADLKDALHGLEKWRHALSSWWQGRDVRRTITYLRDALENRAGEFGRQNASHVRLLLNRALGDTGSAVRKRNELREFALTFAVQADRNRATLAEWHEQIGGSEFADTTWGRRALRAIEFANEHWDALAPVVDAYRTLSETQREVELNAGLNVGEWKSGYVRQLVDGVDPETAGGDLGPQPASRKFTKKRTMPNYAAHIAAGHKPVTLNALDLMSGRIADGQRVLNETAWLESLFDLIDPKTQEPVAQNVEWKPKRPIQTQPSRVITPRPGESFDEAVPAEWEPRAPAGYHVVKLGPATFALHNDYGGLFTALTAPSWMQAGGVRQFLSKTAAAMKHTTLLFDTFHMGRLMFWRTVIGGTPGFSKGVTLADYTAGDIREMVARGEVPAEMAKDLIENKRILDLMLRRGVNIGRVFDNEHLSGVLATLRESGIPGVSHGAKGLGGFNEWLFGQYQRGAMVEASLIEFKRLQRARPEMNEDQLARAVAQDINARFGNLGRQGIFKSKTAQDIARLILLAPQWNESLIRSELGSLRQLGQIPIDIAKGRRLMVGTLLKATGTMILGQFVANQLINWITRGQPTWDNDEEGFGPKVSAYIPDVIGRGPGLFLNPLSIAAEYTHLLESKMHQTGGETDETLRRILNSRESGMGRAVHTFLTKKDELGRSLRGAEVWQAAGKALIPVPIGIGAPAAGIKQVVTGQPSERYPGQFQKQMLSTFGVKTDQAPSAEQRIRSLAKAFNADKGIIPAAEFYGGDFTELTAALRLGNQTDARAALEELLTKKTRQQVAEHYRRWVRAPYTGQTAREREFFNSLTAEQQAQYQTSREARKQLAVQALGMLRITREPSR